MSLLADTITVAFGLKPLRERIERGIARVQISDERILNYWSGDFISEFGKEEFEKFKAWTTEKGISRETLTDFFIRSGYPSAAAETETAKLLLNLSKSLAKQFDNPDIREVFKAMVDVIEENKEDLSVDIEDVLESIEEMVGLQHELLDLYAERLVLLSPRLFTSRNDVAGILEFQFVGREAELKALHAFLEGDAKVMAVFGEGGCGKTRLLVEFASRVGGKVYFVHPEKRFEKVRVEDALLVLDDASKYKDFDRVVDFAVNPGSWGAGKVKLVIVNRSFFENETENRLKAKHVPHVVLPLDGGDVAEFVRVNFGIEKADTIVAESQNNFFYVSLLAEYFKKKGEVDLLKALEYRVEKYLGDVRREPGKLSEEELAIYVLSLIMPIDMKRDDSALREVLRSDYDTFCVAMRSDLVKRVGEREYTIKPDPVGDYIRLKFMTEYGDLFEKCMSDLLVYMPFRISYNVATMPGLRRDMQEISLKLLEGIWEDLNTRDFKSPEYFDALVFFTGILRKIVAEHLGRANIVKWITMAKKIGGLEVRERLAKALFNVAYHYGGAGDFKKVETLLTELRALHEEHKEREVRERLAKALVNATSDYGDVRDFKKVELLLTELRTLHEEHKEKEIRGELSKALVNATNCYGRAGAPNKVELLLTELRALHEEHKEKEIRGELAGALVNATNCYGDVRDFKKVELLLTELRTLHEEHKEKEIRGELAKTLMNVANHYGRVRDFNNVETLLTELRALHEEHKEREVRERLAKALMNAASDYGDVRDFNKVELLLTELRTLHEEHKEKEIRGELAGALMNAASDYGDVRDFKKVEILLTELRVLHEEHKEREVRGELAKALVNAINHYREVRDFNKVESLLTELRALHEEYKEKEVREELAKALYNAALSLPKTGCEYDQIICEAYALRHFLPQDPHKPYQKILEALTIDHTTARIVEIHAKGGDLTPLIETIQAHLDELEFTLLMNTVTEKLPPNIQNALWKTITNLNACSPP